MEFPFDPFNAFNLPRISSFRQSTLFVCRHGERLFPVSLIFNMFQPAWLNVRIPVTVDCPRTIELKMSVITFAPSGHLLAISKLG